MSFKNLQFPVLIPFRGRRSLDSIQMKQHAPSRIVDDLPNNTPDVTVLLSEVQVPQLGRVLVEIGVGSEDTPGLSLGSDDSLQD